MNIVSFRAINTLFFAAGVGNEEHGLYGRIEAAQNDPLIPPRMRGLEGSETWLRGLAATSPDHQSRNESPARAQL
jgi:hypothetical protein